jgi:peptide/nickel transport system substrate-binding protein
MQRARSGAPGSGALSRRTVLHGLGGLAAAGLATACSATGATPASGSTSGGGLLTVGVPGGGSNETIEAQLGSSAVDFARQYQLYDPLVYYSADGSGFENVLAEELTPNATADEWTIRLRDEIEFHHGKTLDADDLIYTLERLADPRFKGKPLFKQNIDHSSMRKLDSRTIRFSLRTPTVAVPDTFAIYTSRIVPVDYDPARPVGTGPFRYRSFIPGQQSLFDRFENHWRGAPLVDQLSVVSFADAETMINALLAGQIQVAEDIPLIRRRNLESNSRVKLLTSTGRVRWTPFVMNMEAPPFTDVRVRQAVRLMVNRQQIVDQVMGVDGQVANDIIWNLPFGPPPDVPQREQDLDQARSLLRAAGQENLSLELVVAPVASGAVPSAQIFATQAREAGIDVRVRQVDLSTFYGEQYLHRTFSTIYWSQQSYLAQIDSMLIPPPGEPYNETHFRDEEWSRLIGEAVRTVDDKQRWELIRQAQQVEYERGGYVVWGVGNLLDAYSSKIEGLTPDAIAPAGSHNFRTVRFAT